MKATPVVAYRAASNVVRVRSLGEVHNIRLAFNRSRLVSIGLKIGVVVIVV